VPSQLDTAPPAVPTTHIVVVVHESAVKAATDALPDPGRNGTGALHAAPCQTRTLPALSTAMQKAFPEQEMASMTPTGSTSTGRDHADPSHSDAPPMAAMQKDEVVQEMPDGPPHALKAPDQVVPSNTYALPIPLITVQNWGLAHARACAPGTLTLGVHETPSHTTTLFPSATRQNAEPLQAIVGEADPGATAGPSDTGGVQVEPFHTDAWPLAPTAPQNVAVAQDTATRLVPTTVTGDVQAGARASDGPAPRPPAPAAGRVPPPGVVAGTVVAEAPAAGRGEAGALHAERATIATIPIATMTIAGRWRARSIRITAWARRRCPEPSPVSLSHRRRDVPPRTSPPRRWRRSAADGLPTTRGTAP